MIDIEHIFTFSRHAMKPPQSGGLSKRYPETQSPPPDGARPEHDGPETPERHTSSTPMPFSTKSATAYNYEGGAHVTRRNLMVFRGIE